MLRYLLDTNIALFVIRRRPPLAAAVFNQHAGRMAVSAITLAELMHGAEKSSRPAANLAVVEDFCSRLEVLPYGPKAAQHYGQIRTALELAGTPIGVDDVRVHGVRHRDGSGRGRRAHCRSTPPASADDQPVGTATGDPVRGSRLGGAVLAMKACTALCMKSQRSTPWRRQVS